MPLDTKDLAAIEEVVSRQIQTKVPAIVDSKLVSIKTDISEMKSDISALTKDMIDVKKDVAEMKKR